MILAAILAALAAIHVYWAVGGKRGTAQVFPRLEGKPAFRPGPAATLAVAGLLFFGSAISAGLVLQNYRRNLMLAMALVFAIRAIGEFRYCGFFKKVTDSEFAYWDTRLYTPLCVLMSALALFY